MDPKRKQAILDLLDATYGKFHVCYLNYQKPYELLFATILSAQCTDDRVNKVTQDLFKKYPSLTAFAEADLGELEQDVHSTGFYRNKAKNIRRAARQLLESYQGQVPSEVDALTSLAGVGRKTANVVRGHVYQLPSVVVDTHVKRISNRLGFTDQTDPVKIEFELMDQLPQTHWSRFNTQIIAHGRSLCKARGPQCDDCFLLAHCPWGLKHLHQQLVEE